MLNLRTIYKPKTLEEALELARQADTALMAGGTALIAKKRRDVRAVIELSGLGLSFIETRGGDLVIGATTKVAAVVESSAVRGAADAVVAQAAHQTHANILRNQATVAGTVISEPDGIFSVALSALDARVTLATLNNSRVEKTNISLADFFAQRPLPLRNSILTEIAIPASSLVRRGTLETVARTPRDKAIVSVCAALEMESGIVRAGAIALGGVASHYSQRTSSRESDDLRAETAWRARDAEREILNQGLSNDVIQRAAMAATSALHPVGDFRGSTEYRIEMVRVLTARALRELAARS